MADVIYLENNDFHDNQNAILAYRNNRDGSLTMISGSPFLTGGSGIGNPMQALGPDDSDDQLIISDDARFLLAVNPGSNTIAVFRIGSEGDLTPVPGSPFPSGGQTPVSINMKGNYVFVANKAMDPLHPTTQNPNYVTLKMDDNGSLSIISGSKFETAAGSSPAQALVSDDGRFLFGADFLGFMLTPPTGTLRSFQIENSGKLSAVAGTPYIINGIGGALGLWQHPNTNILYVGYPLSGIIGIYSISESTGSLNFQSTVVAGPAVCWLRTTKNGNYLYSLNSSENSVSVFNSSNASAPALLAKIILKDSGPTYISGGKPNATSEDFGLAFSADEKILYVISQHTNPDFSIGNYNYLHGLIVAADGTLSEPLDPVQLPVAANIRPQGIKAISKEFYGIPIPKGK